VEIDGSEMPNGIPLSVKSQWTLPSDELLEKRRLHTFNLQDEPFLPARLEVNGRKHRRTCLVIGNDEKHIKVYKIDKETSDGPAARAYG
jgi:anaphase-promoting complex subunit 4